MKPVAVLFLSSFCLSGPPVLGQAPMAPAMPPEVLAAKGAPVATSPTAAEWRAIRAPQRPRAMAATGVAVPDLGHIPPRPGVERVLYDEPGDGHIWAVGGTYKASFGADGFTYIPYFGGEAPRNFPVRFTPRRVLVGGEALPLAAAPEATRRGEQITLDRGALREVYDLVPQQLEQTFVVDTDRVGDVVIELAVDSELVERADLPGLQFGNELGQVAYGEAFLVVDGEQRKVASEWLGDAIRIVVPAALRGQGPVVVDPILQTVFSHHGGASNAMSPDVAYDVSSDTFLVVWEFPFSATDYDIASEYRTAYGVPVSSSLAMVDGSSLPCTSPRVANDNASNQFLVVYEQRNPAAYNGRSIVYGRVRAAPGFMTSAVIQVSNPNYSGEHIVPDIGGDPSPTGANRWCVVWMVQRGTVGSDIHMATVDTTPANVVSSPTVLAGISNGAFANPSISQSNGHGQTPYPGWCVVYSYRYAPTDWDVHGAVVRVDGSIGQAGQVIDYSSLDDQWPRVSSPLTATPFPQFLITSERQNPYLPIGRIVDRSLRSQTADVDLSQFGVGAFWLHPECDGVRFAVVSGSASMGVATLAYSGGNFVLHEAQQGLAGVASWPRIASTHSGGGQSARYGIVYRDEQSNPDRIGLAAYDGRMSGYPITQRALQCGALYLSYDGVPLLGRTMSFALGNQRNDLTGFLVGNTGAASAPLCPGCLVGIDLQAPTTNFLFRDTLSIDFPADLAFLGVQLTVQGYAFGSGLCTYQSRFTNALDLTIL